MSRVLLFGDGIFTVIGLEVSTSGWLSGLGVSRSEKRTEIGGPAMMRKTLLAVIGMAALGIGPAAAADLAARPYTKAPPPVAAAIYDWTGFYIGIDGGGGAAPQSRGKGNIR